MKYIVIPAFLFLTAGCEQTLSLNELCEKDTKMCEDLHTDTWCKRERKAVLTANYHLIESKQDQEKYNMLLALGNYKECMSLAAKIEHIKFKEKNTERNNSLKNAEDYIKKLSDETRNSENPYLLHYHWAHYLNNDALNKFLKLESTKQLETPELQFKLATYFIKTNIDKTLNLLFHALELYKDGDEINVEIFKSIATIFTEKGQPKQSYVWLKMLTLYSPKDKEVTPESLEQFAIQHRLDKDFLDKIAKSTLEKIESGEFTAPKH